MKAIWMQVRRRNVENTIWGKVVASLKFRPWGVKQVRVARGLSNTKSVSKVEVTNLWLVLMQDRITK